VMRRLRGALQNSHQLRQRRLVRADGNLGFPSSLPSQWNHEKELQHQKMRRKTTKERSR
jgi:hypothetical protein